MRTGVRRTGAVVGVLLAAAGCGSGGDEEADVGAGCAGGDEVVLSVDDPEGDMDLTRVTPGGVAPITIDWPDSDLADPASRPDFSPDGARLVVVRADGDYESAGPSATWLWTVAADGSDPRPLTDGAVYDGDPAWSPDGSTIAFVRSGSPASVMVVDADGGEPRPLVADPQLGSTATPADVQVSAVAPTWSPDGTQLAFVREESAGATIGDRTSTVVVVDADGSDLRELAVVPGARTLGWSPDGLSLLVSAPTSGRDSTLHLVELATGEARPLAAGAEARWARDGDGDGAGRLWYLAPVATSDDTRWELQEARLDGTEIEPVGDSIDVDVGFLYSTTGLAVRPCV